MLSRQTDGVVAATIRYITAARARAASVFMLSARVLAQAQPLNGRTDRRARVNQ